MRVKLIGLLAALLLVAACETTPEEAAGIGGEGAAGEPPAVAALEAVETEGPAGPAPGTYEDFLLNVGDRVFFDFDKAVLKPEARTALERQAEWLTRYRDASITIEGHCDERGTREYNLALGERRATAVKNYLVALGVDPSRITAISYGKERPEALDHSAAAWAQNRRGVTVVN